ncbi:MAG: glycosyltransferase family 2 protein, partial [Pseudomonadales bacterium]|nr:glycosyltransferase family 2 protein [Pseudomonadales bacterium]
MLDNLIQIFEQSLTVLLVFIFNEGDLALFLYKFVPFVLFMELPVYAFIWIGVIRSLQRRDAETPLTQPFLPRVSGVILSYSEGYEIAPTVLSFLEQNYAGHIEIIIAVDGSIENSETYQAAVSMIALASRYQNRSIVVLPKIIRGGRVSSFNAAIKAASGEFLMPIDADTALDNNVVQACVRHFIDKNTVAVSGPLRATANNHSVISRLQSIEYMISIYAGKLGLAEFGVINNIPGAFGIFRKSFVNSIGGWNTGTAEDLDMTVRIKQYLGRYPNLKIVFEPKAVA